MKTEEANEPVRQSIELLAVKRTTRSQLRKGDRPWGGRLWEICQLTNRNLIRGRRDGLSGHNITKTLYSVPQVNEAVGQRRFQCLPTEISSTCGGSDPTALGVEMLQVIGEKSAEVIVVGELSLRSNRLTLIE